MLILACDKFLRIQEAPMRGLQLSGKCIKPRKTEGEEILSSIWPIFQGKPSQVIFTSLLVQYGKIPRCSPVFSPPRKEALLFVNKDIIVDISQPDIHQSF